MSLRFLLSDDKMIFSHSFNVRTSLDGNVILKIRYKKCTLESNHSTIKINCAEDETSNVIFCWSAPMNDNNQIKFCDTNNGRNIHTFHGFCRFEKVIDRANIKPGNERTLSIQNASNQLLDGLTPLQYLKVAVTWCIFWEQCSIGNTL